MKIILVLAVALAAASAAQLSSSEIKRQWAGFKVMHAKSYESAAEEDYRMKIFTENLHRVNAHNARFDKGLETFKVGINKYSDLLTHEVTEKLNGLRIDADKLVRRGSKVHFAAAEDATKDKTVDWRQKGFVTPVKDQGQCGSCWSFSATGALEGQLFKKNGKLVSLSEQNLVDCSTSYGNEGCNGGLMDQAFDYVKDNKGINTEASYPYEAVDGRCRYKAQNSAGTDSGFVKVNPTEKDLQDAVAKVGPVSIAIDASNWSFQNYASGIYYDRSCSSRNLDHGVLAVGYGSSGKNDYWIVKNSWGSSWGEDGYIRIARNKKNHCGVATMASYPTV